MDELLTMSKRELTRLEVMQRLKEKRLTQKEAAQLLQIKSRLMLPRPPQETGEEDPREALVQRLLDYQQVKAAAVVLSDRESDWQKIAFAFAASSCATFRPFGSTATATSISLIISDAGVWNSFWWAP